MADHTFFASLADQQLGGRQSDFVIVEWTDSGNADRLVAIHTTELRYVRTWSKWIAWESSEAHPRPAADGARRHFVAGPGNLLA